MYIDIYIYIPLRHLTKGSSKPVVHQLLVSDIVPPNSSPICHMLSRLTSCHGVASWRTTPLKRQQTAHGLSKNVVPTQIAMFMGNINDQLLLLLGSSKRKRS